MYWITVASILFCLSALQVDNVSAFSVVAPAAALTVSSHRTCCCDVHNVRRCTLGTQGATASSSRSSHQPSPILQHRTNRHRIQQRRPNRSVLRSSNLLWDDSLRSLIQSLFRYVGPVPFIPSLAINVALFSIFRSKLLSALTPSGYVHAMALGTLLWTTMGWRGWSYCVLYLILGQGVTKIRFENKLKRGIAESRGGRRGPENVWGSAATSLFCAILSAYGSTVLPMISSQLFVVGFVAALATKLADTFASEIGKAYGKTTFLITTLQRVEPGTEGAISLEGTAAAALGGFLLSMYGYGIGLIDLPSVAVSTIAAFIATNVESLIGATLQGKDNLAFMTNEVVNFVNTLIGGSLAMLAGKFILGMP